MKKILLATVLVLSLLLFTGCCDPLTQEQLDRANEAFATMVMTEEYSGTSEISCFFTCYYPNPREINLAEFLKYCPLSTTLTAGDEEEFQYWLETTQWAAQKEEYTDPDTFFVPVRRYEKAGISSLLMKYAGITADDLNSFGGVVYLEKYDAFYNMTTDFAPGHFEAIGGESDGSFIRFWSETDQEGMREVLTIEKVEEQYFIRSFLQEKAH